MAKIGGGGRIARGGRFLQKAPRAPTPTKVEQPKDVAPTKEELARQEAERRRAQEAAEWKQAQDLMARKGGFPRYDPKSRVGRKIKILQERGTLPPEVIAWQKAHPPKVATDQTLREAETLFRSEQYSKADVKKLLEHVETTGKIPKTITSQTEVLSGLRTTYDPKTGVIKSTKIGQATPTGFVPVPESYFEPTMSRTPTGAPIDTTKLPEEYKSVVKDLETKDVVYKEGKSYFYRDGKIVSQKGRVRTPSQEFISPSLIQYGYDWGASKTIRSGGWLADITRPALVRAGVSEKSWLFDPEKSPIKVETARSLISGAYMFSSLSPFMKTGTAQIQESAYAYDVKTGRFVKKSDLKEYLTQSKVDIVGKKVTIKAPTFSDKADRLRTLLSRATTQEQKKAVVKLAEETYGKTFVKDFISQETGVYFAPSVVTKTTPTIDVGGYTITAPPTMPRIDIIGTTVKATSETIQPSIVGRTEWSATGGLFSETKSGQDTLQKTKSGQRSLQMSMTTQDVFQETKTAQDTLQVSKTMQAMTQATTQVTAQKTVSKSMFSPTFNFGRTVPEKGRAYPFWLPSRKPVSRKKVVGRSWIPQVKSKGKWRNAGKRMDRNSALSRASKGADLSTARSIRIKPSNKPPQVTGIGGWGMRRHKFRPGKKPNTFVEKSAYAIDHINEVRGLSFGKLKKKMRWGIPTPKTKKKKSKKRKSKSPWLF